MPDDIEDILRGTGRTSMQMVEAPPSATFVWCTQDLIYPRELAQFWGRVDLQIVPLGWLRNPMNWRGRELNAVVVDHYARHHMSQNETNNLGELRALLLRYGGTFQ